MAPQEVLTLCLEKGVQAEFFHIPAHRTVYRALMEFREDNEPIDVVTLTNYLRSKKLLENIGGAAFVTDLFTFLPTAANAGYYLEILEEKFTLREIIKVGTEYAARAYDEQSEVTNLLDGLEEGLMRIIKRRYGQQKHERGIKELVQMAVRDIERTIDGTGEIELSTGIPTLDYYTDGLVAPEMTLIMAPPSSGKTALALNIAEHIAVNQGKSVGIISLEMGDIQLVKRLLFAMARMDARKLKRSRQISGEEHERIVKASGRLASARLFIRDDGGLTISEIAATATAWKAKHGLDVLMIDHAQLAKGSGKSDGRTAEVEEISNAIKPLAKKLEIPIVVLSQVTEDRSGNFSAKQSKALEADSDNIWTVSHVRDEETKAITETFIHLSKQRDRERHVSVPLVFNEPMQRFSAKTKNEEPPSLL